MKDMVFNELPITHVNTVLFFFFCINPEVVKNNSDIKGKRIMKINEEFMCGTIFFLRKQSNCQLWKTSKVNPLSRSFLNRIAISPISWTHRRFQLRYSPLRTTDHAKLWPLIVGNANHKDPLHGVIVPCKVYSILGPL